jgi:hypothetical protein
MTRDEIITLVLSRLGNRENDKRLQRICVLECKNIQEDILEQAFFKPWFLLSELEYTQTTVNDARVALPAYFLEEYEEGSLLYRPDPTQPWTPLAKGEMDVIKEWNRLTGVPPGVATNYSIVGEEFVLGSVPTVSYQLAMRYYKRQPLIPEDFGVPKAAEGNKWTDLAPEWYQCELGSVVSAFHVRDQEAAASFKARAGEARDRLYTQHVAREEANMSRVMGYTRT